jgi:hypothetical protein
MTYVLGPGILQVSLSEANQPARGWRQAAEERAFFLAVNVDSFLNFRSRHGENRVCRNRACGIRSIRGIRGIRAVT